MTAGEPCDVPASSGALDLDAIQARVDAATKAPWEAVRDASDAYSWVERPGLATIAVDAVSHADAELIAHARQDVPALLAALADAQAEAANARWESDYRKAVADALQAKHEGGDGSFWADWHRDHCAAAQAAADAQAETERLRRIIESLTCSNNNLQTRVHERDREVTRLGALVAMEREIGDEIDERLGLRAESAEAVIQAAREWAEAAASQGVVTGGLLAILDGAGPDTLPDDAVYVDAPPHANSLDLSEWPDTQDAIDVAHLTRQRDWSTRTFGPGDRLHGVTDHIRKELVEVEEAAKAGEATLPEWVDVIILAFDGAWRSGAEPAEIIAAIKAKQARNEGRTWPDWRTAPADRAIEHVDTQDGAR